MESSSLVPTEATAPPDQRDTGFGYQPALDGIRALAVLAVMAYHDAYVWAKGGFLGVDAFFVLSGFLITTLLVLEYRRGESIGLLGFWGRRIRRLLPALLLVLVFVAIYAVIAMPPDQLDKVRADGLSGLFYVANWRFIVAGQSYFDLFTAASPFRHLWSLAIEEQFYLVWPLVVLGCLRLGRGRLRVLVAAIVAGAVASVFLMSALYQSNDPSRAYYGTDSRAHTLLVGCGLALLLLVWSPRSKRSRTAVQVLGVVGAIGTVWAWHAVGDTSSGYYGLGSLAFAVGVALVIAAVVQPGPGLLRSPLSWGPLRWIGMISYGLYLWHWPIDLWLVEWRVGFGGTALNALRLAVTFVFATASYYLVERPIRHGSLRPRTLRWVAPVGIATVLVTILVATAGAEKPPSYFGAGPNPSACPTPRRDEMAAARKALRSSKDPPRLDAAVDGKRLLLVGDSVACSLQPGLQVVGRAAGFKVDTAAVIACGIASGEVARGDFFVPTNTDECKNLVHGTLSAGLRRARPQVVLWSSTWERANLVTAAGKVLEAGTPTWEKAMLARMDAVLTQLRRDGAKVLVATQASTAPAHFNVISAGQQHAEDDSFVLLNQLLLKFAARHPGEVTLVDLADQVCPGGTPCPEEVDGLVLRPFDGGHFSPAGAVWASEKLLPELEQAGEGRTPGA